MKVNISILAKYTAKIKKAVIAIAGLPIMSWGLRVKIYKGLGANIADNSVIGNNCIMLGDISNLNVEKNVYINHSCFFGIEGKIYINEFARIGPYVRLMTRQHPIEHSIIRGSSGRDIDIEKTIGRGCWIGLGAIILPGASIAEGCVVGAGAIVVTSTTANGLYVGSPARRIRDLPF